MSDWLGTRRLQTDPLGNPQLTCSGGSFGDDMNCVSQLNSAIDATELHFTGKERDSELADDYFGARYYTSNVGRFLTPDWSAQAEPVPYSKLTDPQTLNLYSYVLNNPLSGRDSDGHSCTYGGGPSCAGAPPLGTLTAEFMYSQDAGLEMAKFADLFSGEAAYVSRIQQENVQSATGARLVSISGPNPLELTPLVEHYLGGMETDYTLSDDAFNKFISEMQKDGRLNGDLLPVEGMPDDVFQQQVSAYGTTYALTSGTTTIYYRGGKPVGYRDFWDFDSKPWRSRPVKAELETRGAGLLLNFLTGKPFWVDYGIHPR